MTTLSSGEQLILEMINRARMDPTGEAARIAQTHPGFTLNEGLPAGTISSTPVQVLAGNNVLALVADDHDTAMLNSHVLDYANRNLNPHTQAGDGSEVTRIANHGYVETYPAGQTYHDENVAWQGTSGAIDLATMTQQVEDGLFFDSYDSTRLHRVAIMDGTMREAGVGETTGVVQWIDNNNVLQNYNSVVVTEDFGISGTNSFLTGVQAAAGRFPSPAAPTMSSSPAPASPPAASRPRSRAAISMPRSISSTATRSSAT
jgi:serralysin